jgi:hypothetical protein
MVRHPKKTRYSNEERRDSGLLLLVVALFLFVGALFIEGERDAQQNSTLSSQSAKTLPPATLNRIDQALHESQLKAEIAQDAATAENETAPEVGTSDMADTSGTNPLLFDQENPGARVLKETEKRARSQGVPSADQRIAKKLERDQWLREYEQRRDAEYVRQFLENAKKSGVQVQLNENLEVTGLQRFEVEKPIRVPQSVKESPK